LEGVLLKLEHGYALSLVLSNQTADLLKKSSAAFAINSLSLNLEISGSC